MSTQLTPPVGTVAACIRGTLAIVTNSRAGLFTGINLENGQRWQSRSPAVKYDSVDAYISAMTDLAPTHPTVGRVIAEFVKQVEYISGERVTIDNLTVTTDNLLNIVPGKEPFDNEFLPSGKMITIWFHEGDEGDDVYAVDLGQTTLVCRMNTDVGNPLLMDAIEAA